MERSSDKVQEIMRFAEMGEITLAVSSLYEHLGCNEFADMIRQLLEIGDLDSAKTFLE